MKGKGCLWIVSTFVVLGAIVFSCLGGLFVGLAASDGSSVGGFGDAIAVIEVNGPISGGDDNSIFGEAAGALSGRINRQLKRAQEDPSVKAVVLRVDSPGGGVTASDEIYNEVVRTKAKKKVVISMGTLAASGGYYIAAPADRIVANPTSLTGSIGVITVVPDLSGLLDKLGVLPHVFKSGAQKDSSYGLRPLTDEDRKVWQGLIDDHYGRFVEIVAKGRKLDEATVRRLADGRVYTGRQALENKLVDELGDLPEAIAAAAKLAGINGEPRIVSYRSGGLLSGPASSSWFKPPWANTALAGLDASQPVQYRFIP